MDINKKSSKSNNTPLVIALILIPVLFIFGTMLIVGIVLTTNRPDIKLTVSEATNIKSDQATFNLSVEGDSNKINEKGFVYGTASNPEIQTRVSNSNPIYEIFTGYSYDSYRNVGNYIELDKNGNVGIIDDLAPETKYYVRAYAMTDYGTIYGNEVSFSTLNFNKTNSLNNSYDNSLPKDSTPESRDAKRRADVNLILDAILKLKSQNPEKIPSYPQLSPVPKNLRIGEVFENTPCTYSDIQDDEILLSNALKSSGFNIPQDPQFKSVACTDYSITLEPNKTITISAPNAEISVIKVNSVSQ